MSSIIYEYQSQIETIQQIFDRTLEYSIDQICEKIKNLIAFESISLNLTFIDEWIKFTKELQEQLKKKEERCENLSKQLQNKKKNEILNNRTTYDLIRDDDSKVQSRPFPQQVSIEQLIMELKEQIKQKIETQTQLQVSEIIPEKKWLQNRIQDIQNVFNLFKQYESYVSNLSLKTESNFNPQNFAYSQFVDELTQRQQTIQNSQQSYCEDQQLKSYKKT